MRDISIDNKYYTELSAFKNDVIHFLKFKPSSSDSGYNTSVCLNERALSAVDLYINTFLDSVNVGRKTVIGYMVKVGLARIYFAFRYSFYELAMSDISDGSKLMLGYLFNEGIEFTGSLIGGGKHVTFLADEYIDALVNNIRMLVYLPIFGNISDLYRSAIVVFLADMKDELKDSTLYSYYAFMVESLFDVVSSYKDALVKYVERINNIVGGAMNGKNKS